MSIDNPILCKYLKFTLCIFFKLHLNCISTTILRFHITSFIVCMKYCRTNRAMYSVERRSLSRLCWRNDVVVPPRGESGRVRRGVQTIQHPHLCGYPSRFCLSMPSGGGRVYMAGPPHLGVAVHPDLGRLSSWCSLTHKTGQSSEFYLLTTSAADSSNYITVGFGMNKIGGVAKS